MPDYQNTVSEDCAKSEDPKMVALRQELNKLEQEQADIKRRNEIERKPWIDLTLEQQVERLRTVVNRLANSSQSHQEENQRLREALATHQHDQAGKCVTPYKQYGGTLPGQLLSGSTDSKLAWI